MAQIVTSPPAMQKNYVPSLGHEDLLEKEIQYSCLENPMDRERSLLGYSLWCRKEST